MGTSQTTITRNNPDAVAISKMTKLLQTIETAESEGSRSAARKHLRKLAAKNPAIAAAQGVEVGPIEISRVYKYGCLDRPVVMDNTEWSGAVRQQMTLRIDYYNYLVAATRPLFVEARAALNEGPNFNAASKLFDQIGKLYARISELNQASRGRSKDPEVDSILAEIKVLDDDLDKLRTGVGAELSAFYKGQVYTDIIGDKLALIRKSGAQKYSVRGLHHANSDMTSAEFKQAFEAAFKKVKTILRGLKGKYSNKNGEFPESVGEWVAWDGAGRYGVAESHKSIGKGDKKKPNPNRSISSVLDGTNSMCRLRPLTDRDLPYFPAIRNFDLSRKSSGDLYLAQVLVKGARSEAGAAVWASIPVKLHRPLPANAEFAAAVVKAEKENFKLKRNLLITIVTTSEPESRPDGAIAKVTIGGETPGVLGSVVRTQDTEFKLWATGDGQRFGWLSPDGTLLPNMVLAGESDHSESLDAFTNEHIKQAIVRFDELLPSATMPDWFYQEGFDLTRRRSIRRFFHVWRDRITQGAADPESAKESFRVIRAQGRELVKADWDLAVTTVSYAIEENLGLPFAQAQILAIASIVTERYEHLYPWAANVRASSLRCRKDEYRKFAKHFLKGVRTLHIPAPSKHPKRLSAIEADFASSIFLEALKSVADRQGITVVLDKKEDRGTM